MNEGLERGEKEGRGTPQDTGSDRSRCILRSICVSMSWNTRTRRPLRPSRAAQRQMARSVRMMSALAFRSIAFMCCLIWYRTLNGVTKKTASTHSNAQRTMSQPVMWPSSQTSLGGEPSTAMLRPSKLIRWSTKQATNPRANAQTSRLWIICGDLRVAPRIRQSDFVVRGSFLMTLRF